MAAEHKIDSEFFGRDRGPVRRFAGDEHVDLVLRDAVNLATGAAGDDADGRSFLGAKQKCFRLRDPSASLSLLINSSRDIETFAFSPSRLPFSSKNRSVVFKTSARASIALLPTSG